MRKAKIRVHTHTHKADTLKVPESMSEDPGEPWMASETSFSGSWKEEVGFYRQDIGGALL